MKRAHVHISGRVQGVWFRDTTLRQAQAMGVAGWVRNLRDGRVEAVFEGPGDVIDRMVAWCWTGSPNSQVTAVDVAWEEPTGVRGFSIR